MSQIMIEGVSGVAELKTIMTEVIEQYYAGQKKEVKYLTRKEVRELLRVSYPTLDKCIKDGTLSAYKLRGRILFRNDEIELARFTFPGRVRRGKVKK